MTEIEQGLFATGQGAVVEDGFPTPAFNEYFARSRSRTDEFTVVFPVESSGVHDRIKGKFREQPVRIIEAETAKLVQALTAKGVEIDPKVLELMEVGQNIGLAKPQEIILVIGELGNLDVEANRGNVPNSEVLEARRNFRLDPVPLNAALDFALQHGNTLRKAPVVFSTYDEQVYVGMRRDDKNKVLIESISRPDQGWSVTTTMGFSVPQQVSA